MTTIVDRYNPAPEQGTLLLHASSLDFFDSTGELYRSPVPSPIEQPDGRHVDDAMRLLERIHELKLGRESASRAVDMANPVRDVLRQDGGNAIDMLGRLAGVSLELGLSHRYYGLADIPGMGDNSMLPMYAGRFNGAQAIIRAEEGLTPHAADIAARVKRMIDGGASDFVLSQDRRTVYRPLQSGERAKLPLYQYTFTHGSGEASQREFFPDFPSCETFLAATVLEQAALGETIVRLVPSTFINKEVSARSLLDALGVRGLPVLSVAVSPSGNVSKIFPWQQETPDTNIQDIISEVKNNRAHVLSTRVAKEIHDTIFHQHKDFFDRYKSKTRLLSPASYMHLPDMNSRITRFELELIPAAPIFEAHRISPETLGETINNLVTLGRLLHFDITPIKIYSHTADVKDDEGEKYDSVIATKTMLRMPVRSFATYAQTMVIIHAVYEGAEGRKLEDLRQRSPSYEALIDRMGVHSPRYVLVEVRRAVEAKRLKRRGLFQGS